MEIENSDDWNESKINYNNYDKKESLFKENKKGKYSLPRSYLSLVICEKRLLNDLEEFKISKLIGKTCKIQLHEYQKIEDKYFELIIDFGSYFSVKCIFYPDYPCSPPSIIYYKGLKPKYIFDDEGKVLIENLKKEKWNPTIWLSTLVYYIELLISKGKNNYNNIRYINNDDFLATNTMKYGKRKWSIYIDELNNYYNKDILLIPGLEKNLKCLKI